MEQDKILQGGSRGGYRRDRNEEGGEAPPKRNNYYKDDKWSKEGGGQYSKQGGGKYEEGAPKMNTKQGSRNFEDKQQYVYVVKEKALWEKLNFLLEKKCQ